MILALPANDYPCGVHTTHGPKPIWTHRHHVILKSWTDALGLPEGRIAVICPHGHDAIHHALVRVLRGEPYPPLGIKTRALVEEAVDFYNAHFDAQPQLTQLAERSIHYEDSHRGEQGR